MAFLQKSESYKRANHTRESQQITIFSRSKILIKKTLIIFFFFFSLSSELKLIKVRTTYNLGVEVKKPKNILLSIKRKNK